MLRYKALYERNSLNEKGPIMDYSNICALVVDDEEELRGPLRLELKDEGITVLEAEDGQKAFEILENNKIDIVISDIRMPNWDGVKFLETCRKKYPNRPIVVLVSGFTDHSEESLKTKGADAIYKKPLRPEEYLEILGLLE